MPRATEQLTLTACHARLVEFISLDAPHSIPNWQIADSVDFDDRAAHLRQVLAAVQAYVRAALQDIKAKAVILVEMDAADGLSDACDEVVGQLENCADDLRNGMGKAA